jgi:isopenicillin N synthase-like dioxygenase
MSTALKLAAETSFSLPVIDVGGLREGDPRCRAVAQALRQACTTTGFFYVTNHGVADADVAMILAEGKRFFDEPTVMKERVSIHNTKIFRGYDGVGTEALNQATGSDNKESMYLGVEHGPDHPLVLAGTPHHGLNQWPDWLPGWRQSVDKYFTTMNALARRIIKGIALSLDLPWTYFDAGMGDAMRAVRLLHYPPHPTAHPDRELGCGAHTDFGMLTILAQDEIGGLEVQLPSGEWIPVPPIPGAFIVNIGDITMRWTNDIYTSARHRVMNRSPHDRYSVAFFVNTSFNSVIECLPTCRSRERPVRYPPITAGAHLIEMKNRSYGYK